ncbi:extracellular solute-binding protein [Streptococcus merionis]|uniref:ABC transporter substrate-binding protein n=1 Tax=Streptococcus merionis TaxID=400065 RepID=A0A239SVG5_9STRE|nr:extracellular solute-binding protein [Streptococcus merionis]SNU88714.1 ABC transporter substrate-binding protein [Streptococcus merionis]
MKLKKFVSLFTTSIVALSLVACADGGSKTEETAVSSEGPADRSETLVIYSNSVSNGRGEWLTAKAKEEGFNIEMVDIAGAELADRVIAEKNNGIADMVFGIGAVDSNKLRDEELLIKFEPEWKDKIEASLADKDGYYNPVIVQPLVLIGRKDVTEMPKDWTELGAKYAGKYSINGLQGGTPRAILASILVRYLDEKGELGVSEEGWKVAKEYIQNAYVLQKGESSVVKMLDDNDPVVYGMMWGSGVLVNQKEFNTEFQVMSPKVGVPFVTEQTAILASSKRKALAKEFINWFGSSEIQVAYAKEFGSIPANSDAVKELPEDTQKLLDSVHQQDIDWEVVGQYLDQWVEKTELEFVK